MEKPHKSSYGSFPASDLFSSDHIEDRSTALRLQTMLLIYGAGLSLLLALYLILPGHLSLSLAGKSGFLRAWFSTFIAFGFARTSYYRIACFILMASSLFGIFLAVSGVPSQVMGGEAMPWLVVNAIICSLTLSLRENLVVSTVTSLAYLILAPFLSSESQDILLTSWLCYATNSAIALMGTHLRKQSENGIRERERFIQSTFQNAAIGILHIAPDNKIMMANPAFTSLLGYSEVELRTMHVEDLSHPEDRDSALNAIRQMISGGSSYYRSDKRYLRKDGTTVWAHLSTRLIRDEKLRPLYFSTVVQDISERKESERLIEHQRVKMMHASKMSELGEVSSGIAHEINNPLTIIQGKAIQLRNIAEAGLITPANVVQAANKIEVTCLRISKIVRALRSFARDADEDPYEVIDVESIISDTFDLCNQRYKNHDIKLHIDPSSHITAIECQPVQISQVLLNLLNNAYDAVENASDKWVRCSVTQTTHHIEIAITDSGFGIEPELLEKILLPFFTTKEVGKGTGLGLSVSLGIIEAHQGTLTVDTQCLNTRFVVRLPKTQKKRLLRAAA